MDSQAQIDQLTQQVSSMRMDLELARGTILQLQTQVNALTILSNPTSNINSPSNYAVASTQQVAQQSRYDVQGFIYTNNSPGAGALAWSQGQFIYQGVAYNIAAGSAPAGNFYIYWQKSNPNIFQSSPGPLTGLGIDDWVVAANASGLFLSVPLDAHTATLRMLLFGDGTIWSLDVNGKINMQISGSASTLFLQNPATGIVQAGLQGSPPLLIINQTLDTTVRTFKGYMLMDFSQSAYYVPLYQ